MIRYRLAWSNTSTEENMRYIFDLDHTLICSKHRTLTRADGSLNLAAWVENCTREKIFADSLLPLADYALDLISQGYEVIACTARVLSTHDRDFFAAHGLHFCRILSRPHGDTRPDWQLKGDLFRQDAATLGLDFAAYAYDSIFFDDNDAVLQHAAELGIIAFQSKGLNAA